MRLAKFLFSILCLLILLALVGFIDWSTVGNWVIFMIILSVLGNASVVLFLLYSWWDDNKAKKTKSDKSLVNNRESKNELNNEQNSASNFSLGWVLLFVGCLILFVGCLILFFGYISSLQNRDESNLSESSKVELTNKSKNDNKDDEVPNFKPNLINRTVRAIKEVKISRERSSYPTHILHKNAVVKVINETPVYIQFSTNQGNFWGEKDFFEVFASQENEFTNSGSKKNEVNLILKPGIAVIGGISVRKKPDIFSEKIFELEKGEKVFIYGKIPNTIYLQIKINGNYYYVAENALNWDKN